MIDIRKICRDACDGVPLSLRDDPTTWSEAPTMQDVRDAVEQATQDNVTSALAKALGAVSEEMATAMDAAIVEDGPLADLEAIWSETITGTVPDLDRVLVASDWEARVEALREVMRNVATAIADNVAVLIDSSIFPDNIVANVIIADMRLAHLKDEPFTPPAFLGLDPADAPSDFGPGAAAGMIWDDEDEEVESLSTDAIPLAGPPEYDWTDIEPGSPADPTPLEGPQPSIEPAPTGRRGRGKRNGQGVPKLCGLLEAAGFADKEISALLGIDKSYYSLIRSGKRPWQGLRDDVAEKLRLEIGGRQDALRQSLLALDEPTVRNPDV